MSSGGKCEECGMAIPADSPGGFCAHCLLTLGLQKPGQLSGLQSNEEPLSQAHSPGIQGLAFTTPLTEKPGDRIGRYRLLEEIGHGGCGVVYLAEQEVPIRRKVAVKVIKLGMDTKQVVARFEAERQALALMDHPNIAKVHDAGAAETGRPYFVMELVGGIKITDYCDQNHLTTRERLDLFIPVCDAIQHAHQKGIIHRDIKPSNVLVTIQDGKAVPKVIDFGIAKATQGRLVDQTLFTAFEQFLGTPAYMSPEQAQLGSLDVDTRSDIYSLGVLLYELLAGKTPFDTKAMLAAGLDEMRRTIREVEPVKPSTRLTQERAALSVAPDKSEIQNQKSEIDKDLDWIVMKCLEKDRARRYETANGLACDIERHLKQEPVVARPPSSLYSLQKLFLRNKGVVTAGALVAMVLLLGIAGVIWQWHRAEKANRNSTRSNEDLRRALYQMDSIQLQRAEEYLEEEHRLDALPRWALVLRNNPSNRIAAERLMSTLSHRTWARLACPPMEHSNRVTMAMFSADGKRVVTSSADNTAWVWDAETGQRLVGPFAHSAEVNMAAFSPDGQFIVTASQDKTARIWNAITGEAVTPPLRQSDGVSMARFNPASTLVLTTSGSLGQLWNARSGQQEGPALAASNYVHDARFSPDGSRLAMACEGGQAQVWEVASGACQHRLKHAKGVRSVAFSPDGRWLVTASDDKTARLWDVEIGQLVGRPLQHQNRVYGAEFSPDGQRIVTASYDHTAQIWDARTSQRIGPPLKHDAEVRAAVFSPEGLRVATAAWDHTTRVWDALTGEPLTEPLVQEADAFSVEFDPRGERLLTVSNGKATMIWDISPALALKVRLGTLVPWCADFSPDGKRFVVGTDRLYTRVWDVPTGNALTTLAWNAKPKPLGDNWAEFSPDGRLIVVGSDDGGVGVWESRTGQPIHPVRVLHTGPVVCARFSHDGRSFVTASWDGRSRVWDARTGQPLASFVHDAALIEAEFSPDDRSVLTTAFSNRVARLWEVRTGHIAREFYHEAKVNSAHFSPDGRRVLTGSSDFSARVWDAQTGALVGTLPHANGVLLARFSPDGQLIVTADRLGPGSLRVWDAHTFKPITELFGEGSFPEFDPSSQRLIGGVVERGANPHVWDARTGLRLSDGLLQSEGCRFSHFSPDGRLVIIGTGRNVQVRETPPAALPVPEWLAELAEALAGQRFSEQGRLERVRLAELWGVQQRMLAWANGQTIGHVEADLSYAGWAKWFVADAKTRTVSPSSRITLPEYVQSLLKQETPESRREALLLQPANAMALALAGEGLTNQLLAVWMTRRSTELAPDRFETWHHLAGALNEAGRRDEAIAAMEHAVALNSGDANLWLAHADLLHGTGHLEAAVDAYGKVIQLSGSRHAQQKQAALLRRSQLLTSLGRHAESQVGLLKPTDTVSPEKVIFEMASESDLKGWTLKGNAFSFAARSGLFPQPTLNSLAISGEAATGSALSPPFRVEPEFEYVDVTFQGGWNQSPQGDENLVLRFLDADSGTVLDQLLPPGTHELRTGRLKTTNLKGKSIRLLLLDNNTNATYAWIGLSKVSLVGPLAK